MTVGASDASAYASETKDAPLGRKRARLGSASRICLGALCCALALPAWVTLTVSADVPNDFGPTPPPPPPPPQSGPIATPSRADVARALGERAGEVRGCAPPNQSGELSVRVTFVSSGRVERVVVTSTLPEAAKVCVAEAVQKARVAPFRQQTFNVVFPYRY